MRLSVLAQRSSTYDDQKETSYVWWFGDGFVIFSSMATDIHKSNGMCYLAEDNADMHEEKNKELESLVRCWHREHSLLASLKPES